MTKRKRRSPDKRISPRVKVWIEVDGDYIFGRGISEILQAVEETGSIKRAAETLGKSYRHVWDRLKNAETSLGASLVETQVGGRDAQRSRLTDLGRALFAEFERLRERIAQLLHEEFPEDLEALLRKK